MTEIEGQNGAFDSATFIEAWVAAPTPADRHALVMAHLSDLDDLTLEAMRMRANVELGRDLSLTRNLASSFGEIADATGRPLPRILALFVSANIERGSGDMDSAWSLYTDAAALCRQIDDAGNEARAQIGLATVQVYRLQYADALRLGTLALWLARRQSAKFVPERDAALFATIYGNLANIFMRLGRYQRALELHRRALAVLEQAGVAGQSLMLRVYNNIAMCYQNIGEYGAARESIAQAVALADQSGMILEKGLYSLTLGAIDLGIGEYNSALRGFSQALDIFEQAGTNTLRQVFLARFFQTECYLALNLYDNILAAPPLPVAEMARMGLLQEASRHRAHISLALGRVGRRIEAIDALHEVRELLSGHNNTTELARVDLQLGELFLLEKRYTEAEAAASRALAGFEEQAMRVDTGKASMMRARILFEADAVTNADAIADAANTILQLANETDSPALAYDACQLLGQLETRRGNEHEAAAHFSEAIATAETLRGRVALDLRSAFIEDKLLPYQELVRLAFAHQDYSGAIEYAERAKSRGLAEMLAAAPRINLRVRTPRDQPLLDRYAAARQEYDWYYNRMAYPSSFTDDGPALSDDALRAALRERERVMNEVLIELQVRDPVYAEEMAAPSVDLISTDKAASAIAAHLDPNTALLEYYTARLDDPVYVFVVGQDGAVRAWRTKQSLRQIDDLRLKLLSGLTSFVRSDAQISPKLGTVPELSATTRASAILDASLETGINAARLGQSERRVRTLLHALYSALFVEPESPGGPSLLDVLAGYQRLMVVPHGALHYLPMHALYDRVTGQYVLERWQIAYLPSATLLPRYAEPVSHDVAHFATPLQALVLGYNRAPAQEVGQQGDTPALGDIEQEAREVAALFGVQPRLKDAAVRAALNSQNAAWSVVHIAAHGRFNPQQPLFSSLTLADGRLTTADIYGLALPTSLLTLSACETGAHTVSGGDELNGLSRACLYAGARSLVLSLWKAFDRPTARLMHHFYRNLLEGQDKAAALRSAQIALMHEVDPDSGIAYSHPSFWAPFILIGAPGPL